ncbi:carbohydrate ABC transporter permease [uncultured Robinsoniella sp.]|uniref:carbohydrate ABC transporter permease n=1 Tax=uncultured Robinsoniella sp. TaxID=904190 RepID=UPI00374EBCAB
MIQSKSSQRFQILANSVMTVVTILIIIPFILLFMSSITSENALIRDGYSFFPKEISLEAYRYILKNASSVFRAYGITILVTLVGTAGNTLLSALLAYPLSLKDLPFKRAITFYVFFTMLFNGGLVPSYLMWSGTFHINNTIWAYIMPGFLMSAMNVLLIRTFFANSIPDALFEAAQIDGASQFRIFGTIVLPLGKPILVAMGLFAGLGYWNDWTNGLYYVRDTNLYGIQNLLNKMITDIKVLSSGMSGGGSVAAANIPSASVRMAIAFVAMVPILCCYPFLQKYFAKGIAIGAVKG